MQSRSSELLNNMLVQIKLRSLLAQTKLRFFQVCVCVCFSCFETKTKRKPATAFASSRAHTNQQP